MLTIITIINKVATGGH